MSGTISFPMNKYQFSESEKIAIWTADGRKCFYEGTPVLYRDLQIDHVVPESTSEAEMSELGSTLPENFAINSVENWVTCHQGCNCRKGSTLFEHRALVFYLEMAKKRAPKVRDIMEAFRNARDNEKFLTGLVLRLEQGRLTSREVLAAMRAASKTAETRNEPWVVAFGVNFCEPLPEGAPEGDPQLSDWLIARLNDALTRTRAIFQVIDEERTGETTSVRYALCAFDFDRIQQQIDFCWNVLAVQKYSELFDDIPDI